MKLLLIAVVGLIASAPMIDSGSELIAALGLALGLLCVAALFLTAWRYV